MTNTDRPLRAVVLAAGQGTRMKSDKPKVLHPVMGKTILDRVLDATAEAGVERAHVVIGHGAKLIEAHLDENSPSTSMKWSTHLQEPQLGTGHALMQVKDGLEGFQGDLIVTVGDAPLLKGETLKSLVRKHRDDDAMVTVLSAIVEDPKSYGRVVRDSQNQITAIVEAKDATEEQIRICEVNAAIYCLKWPEVEAGLDQLSNDNKQNEYYLTDLVSWASKNSLKLSCQIAEDWREVAGINSRLELAEVNNHLRHDTVNKLALESGVTIIDPASTWIAPEVKIGKDSIVYPGCEITGAVEIGSGSTIGPGAIIRASSKASVTIGNGCTIINSVVLDSRIGDGCRIGPFAHVREGNDLADGVRVGNFVELKKAKVGARTNVSHLSYVGDATLGSGANVGDGTITANYNHITKVKARTILGDGASTGSNSVLVAPVHIGDNAVVGAGTVVTKDVPAGALAVGRAKQIQKEGWAEKRKEISTAATK